MPDNPPAARSACNGDHHYAHHLRGGEPLSIPICTLCGEIGWADIREQIATAVLPAHRAMWLEEAVQAIETLLDRYHQDLTLDTPEDTAAYRAGRGAVMDVVALVRRLAATAPPMPPAPTVEPENGPAVPEARAVPIEDLIEEISAADPEFRAAVERTERESLRSENTRLRDLVRRYEGTDNDSELTYAELESERDRLAVDLYRAQDCGHDLERSDAHTVALTRVRKILDLLRQPGGTVSSELTAQLLDTALGDVSGPSGMDVAEFTTMERLAGDVTAQAWELAEAREQAAGWMHEATRQAAERDANYAEVQRLTAERDRLAQYVEEHRQRILNGHQTPGEPDTISQVRIDVDAADPDGLRAEIRRLDHRLRWMHDHGDGDATASMLAGYELASQRDAARAERDRMADTIRRYEPVIEAAKALAVAAWKSTAPRTPVFEAFLAAVAGLGDADQDEPEFRPMTGTVTAEDMRLVARATGGRIRSADLKVEFEDEPDGSSTADPTSPTDTESGQRGRDEGTTTPEETNDGR